MRIDPIDRRAARLQAAGWKQTFRIVRAGPNTIDDGIRWQDPVDGSIYTEPEALRRAGERVIKGAFRDTTRRWQAADRDVPLVWDHGRDPREVIGSVDSSTMEERDAGLYIEASLDIKDSELAREAWRSVKRGRISLSFGYLTEAEREGADGVKELTRLGPDGSHPDLRAGESRRENPQHEERRVAARAGGHVA